MIRIAIAEDNNFLAVSLIEKCSFFSDLNFKFRGVDGLDLLNQLEKDHNIDVVLMDIQMPNLDGIETTEKVKMLYPHIKIIMVTVFDDEENIFNSILNGANGYLLKDEPAKKMHESILEIMNGGAPMSASIALKAIKLLRTPLNSTSKEEIENPLTKRETEILEQLSKGLNSKDIADNLFISHGTVRKHVENIYKKLQVHNKTEAISIAYKNRLIS